MYLVLGTADGGRSRVGTRSADDALNIYARMAQDGLAPRILDVAGRPLSVDRLEAERSLASEWMDLRDQRRNQLQAP
jgi:hypothetical protein